MAGLGDHDAVDEGTWRPVAAQQAGLITRAQLRDLGVARWAVQHRIETERWTGHGPVVISTTTGALTREQLMWLGVLHAGPPAVVGDLTAAELAGLRHWHRDEVTVLVPANSPLDHDVDGIRFVRTRRDLDAFRRRTSVLPTCALEPAVLHFAAYQPSKRTAQGVLAACVQQGLTTPEAFLPWIDRMRPLRWTKLLRRALSDIAGGAQSLAEIDVRRMCRSYGIASPTRQVKRRDSSGRPRFTDCEWRLPDGRVLILEVDGGFHMEAEHWEEDLARQRALSAGDRLIVRCTARELRDNPGDIARDLRALGVPA